MRNSIFVALLALPAFSQFVDLGTNSDGSILVFKSQFRLQTETTLRSEQKIYRWQNGVFDPLGVQPPQGGLIPGGIYDPFVIGDGRIYGWQDTPSHGLFPPVEIYTTAKLFGLTIPADFPLGEFRISANGRYVTGSRPTVVSRGPAQVLDTETGARAVLPAGAHSVQVASDATVAYLTGDWASSSLVVQAPEREPRVVADLTHVLRILLSSDGQWLAAETTGAANAPRHTVHLFAAADGTERAMIEQMVDSPSRAPWSLSNDCLCYIATDGRFLALNPSTLATRALPQAPEPYAAIAVSDDSRVAYAATAANRLWRFNIVTGDYEEIAPPLGYPKSAAFATVIGPKVPGSAVLLPGNYTLGQQVAVDGDPWPISDLNASGLWVQAPWEWHRTAPQQTLTVRAPGNPFENVASITYDDVFSPYFPLQYSQETPTSTAIIAAHEDFHGVVSKADPALSGETIHVYMTGLGPLERALATGVPGPPDTDSTLRPIVCKGQTVGSSDRIPLTVFSAVFAPAMIGIYQVDLAIPTAIPDGPWFLHCGDFTRDATGFLFTKPR